MDAANRLAGPRRTIDAHFDPEETRFLAVARKMRPGLRADLEAARRRPG